jgi:hypothetical protein
LFTKKGIRSGFSLLQLKNVLKVDEGNKQIQFHGSRIRQQIHKIRLSKELQKLHG